MQISQSESNEAMSVADEIKSRLDIVEYVQQQVPQLKRAGRTYKAPCPFHNEKTPSFVVNPDTQSWRCFGSCAEGGDIFSFAMKKHGWTFGEALRELGALAGVEVEKQSPDQKDRSDYLDRLRGLLQTAADYYHRHLLSGVDADTIATLKYARSKRGFSDETIEQYQIGYAPKEWTRMFDALKQLGYSDQEILDTGLISHNEASGRSYDRFRNRLMIPIRDERGRVVGFGARALDPDDNPKYLNSPQTPVFDKSRLLFGLDRGKEAIRSSETAVIVEGYMDAIQAHQAGYLNVVAQMGTAMTESQLRLLVPRYARKIIMALDADAAGQNATRRSLEVAREALQEDFTGKLAVDIRILQIPGAKDPDDLLREDPAQWQKLIDDAMPVAEFVIQMETQNLGPNATVQEREAAARVLLPILSASENNLYKRDNLQKLAMRLRISEQDLLQWAQELGRQQATRPAREPRRSNAATKPDAAQPSRKPPPTQKPQAWEEAPPWDDAPPPPMLDGPYFDEDPDDLAMLDGLPTLPPRPTARPAAQPGPPRLSGRNNSYQTEQFCIRQLILNPDLLYQANRRLRELAGESADLSDGPLSALNDADFSQNEYRALFAMLHKALNQHDLDALDYMRHNMDEALSTTFEALLAADAEMLKENLRQRHSAEFATIWQAQTRREGNLVSTDSFIEAALLLRDLRLRRDMSEFGFLMADARNNQDKVAEAEYDRAVTRMTLALRQLQQRS